MPVADYTLARHQGSLCVLFAETCDRHVRRAVFRGQVQDVCVMGFTSPNVTKVTLRNLSVFSCLSAANQRKPLKGPAFLLSPLVPGSTSRFRLYTRSGSRNYLGHRDPKHTVCFGTDV